MAISINYNACQSVGSQRSVCGGVIRGPMTYHRELEAKIARFLGCEAALTFISRWGANIGLIPTLAGSKSVRGSIRPSRPFTRSVVS